MRSRNPTLIFRADADRSLGNGHLMRCLALAGAWQQAGGETCCITRCDNEPLRQRLRANRVEVIPIAEGTSDPEVLELTLATLKKYSSPWLAVDHYGIRGEFHAAVCQSGNALLVVDDNAHLPRYDADILLNQNIHAHELNYSLPRETLSLLGTRYALLRPEFNRCVRPAREAATVARRILVTLGGADPENVTRHVVEALKRLEIPGLQARIVLGHSNPHRPELEDALAGTRGHLKLLSAVDDMPALMQWAELAVSAAGSTCWELAYMGLPALLFVLADNQEPIAHSLVQQGAALSLGSPRRSDVNTIATTLERLILSQADREALSSCIRPLVDGKGASRVVDQMTSRGAVQRDRFTAIGPKDINICTTRS